MQIGSYRFTVGIDLGSREHEACAVDVAGQAVDRLVLAHDGEGLERLLGWLDALVDGERAQLAVALESPHGSVVEFLLDQGIAVYVINPKQLDRFRDRHTVAGAKDDSRDALVLGDSLRTDTAKFRKLVPEAPETIRMRELLRIDEQFKDTLLQLTNRLRDQLQRFFPQMLELVKGADEVWFWELLELVPTPEAARKVRPSRLAPVLKRYRVRRFTAREVLAVLRKKPVFARQATKEAASEHIRFLLPQLRLVHEQRQVCQRDLAKLLEELPPPEPGQGEHRDADLVQSLPGFGWKNSATMLVEASEPLHGRDLTRLRALAGIAPVTKRTGGRQSRPQISMRKACNQRLREALFHAARTSIQNDDHFREVYEAQRARGHSYGRALRGVGEHLLRVLVGMLRSREPYEPGRWSAKENRCAA